MALRDYKADLHIHTCLSPCADWEMSPRRIIQRCREVHLDVVAVCDHNSVENTNAVAREERRRGVLVLPGLEVCSREEVHVLAIFDGLEQALAMQDIVYAHLSGSNRPDLFGHQIVTTEADKVLAENPRLLIGATRLGLGEIVRATQVLDGLSLAAHVDRPANSIINQLGLLPEGLEIDAVEVSHWLSPSAAHPRLPAIRNLLCVTSSDAHALRDIGRAGMARHVAAPSVAEIKLALRGRDGRRMGV